MLWDENKARGVNWRALLALPLLACVAGCGRKTEAVPPPEMPPASVTAVTVETRDVPVYIREIGKCASPEVVSIQPQVSGRVTGIHFSEGTDVKKGDKLFTIDARPFQAALDEINAELKLHSASLDQAKVAMKQYEASVLHAQAELAESQARQRLNILEFERAKGLMETNAIARQEFDNKQVAVTVGEAQIKASEAGIEQAKAQLQQGKAAIEIAEARIVATQATLTVANLNIEYTTIYSPLNGRAGQRNVDVGNIVTANGNGAPLVMIHSIDPIYTDFTIPEAELGRVRESMTAGTLKTECWVPDQPAQSRDGGVIFLDSSVQGSTGTIKLRAKLANEDRRFWPGQFVNVRLVLGTAKEAKLVPAPALQIGQTGPFVYVIKADSTVELRPVKPGLRHGELLAINEGLNGGENVVLSGQLMLYPGAKVAVTPPAAEKNAPAKGVGTAEAKSEAGATK